MLSYFICSFIFTISFLFIYLSFGRKTALLISVILHIGGGCGSAFAPNYESFVCFRFIVGMSNMGIFMSSFVLGGHCLLQHSFLKQLVYQTNVCMKFILYKKARMFMFVFLFVAFVAWNHTTTF